MKELSCLLPTLNEYDGAIKDTALLQSPADKNLTLGDIPGWWLPPPRRVWDGHIPTWGPPVLGSPAGTGVPLLPSEGREEVLGVLV